MDIFPKVPENKKGLYLTVPKSTFCLQCQKPIDCMKLRGATFMVTQSEESYISWSFCSYECMKLERHRIAGTADGNSKLGCFNCGDIECPEMTDYGSKNKIGSMVMALICSACGEKHQEWCKQELNIIDPDSCDTCHEIKDKMFVCSRCKEVRYCSTECQKEDWSSHKNICKTK